VVARQLLRVGRGGGGGSTVAAASLVAEAAAWQKRDFSGSSSAFGNAVAAWGWQWQQRCVGGGSMAYADNNLIIRMMMMIDYWLFLCCMGVGKRGGRGLAASEAGGHRDGQQWQSQWWLFEQKRGWTRKKKRGNWKMGLFFSCCLILKLFFGLPFSMQVNWFLPLLLRAAVTIVVKKKLVNRITFFYIL
jgi:hypothetical protein